ncbi:BamA/TamA family outer membrane protein [bacterium]
MRLISLKYFILVQFFMCAFIGNAFCEQEQLAKVMDLDTILKKDSCNYIDALDQKKEGSYWAVIGGPAYNPDLGLIIALLTGYYYNGYRADERFNCTPYINALTFSVSGSTKGMYSFLCDWDAPYYKHSVYRVRGRILYMKNLVDTYFGIGEETLEKLQTPNGKTFTKYNDYYDNLSVIQNGQTDAYYNFFRSETAVGNINVERDMFSRFFRLICGVYISKVHIHDYTGDTVSAKLEVGSSDRDEASMRTTKLLQDYQSNKIIGLGESWNNNLRFGMAYDTRDYEVNPKKGMFHDLFYILSSENVLSDFDYTITTLTMRSFVSPLDKYLNLVLAARLMYSIKNGDVPFYVMNNMPSSDRHVTGLGGETTLRGFRQNRFIGPVMMLGNIEFRYSFWDFYIKKELMSIMIVPFWDFGRVFNNFENTTLKNIKYSYGLGFRASYNQGFILSIDFGVSSEESMSFYLNFGSMF